MNDMYKLLDEIDRFCTRHGIDYFATGDLLVGSIVYGDLISVAVPAEEGTAGGSKALAIGLLRPEYEKLKLAFGEDASTLVRLSENLPTPTLELAEGDASVNVVVYDELTDDYDLTRFQLFRIRNALKLLRKVPDGKRAALEHHVHKLAKRYDGEGCGKAANLIAGSDKAVNTDEVAVVKTANIGPVTIHIPHDTSYWIQEDHEAELACIKLVQQDALRIVREFDRICRANDIGYFMSAGTLLGAIRHKGFIPWDDDIDIGMLRPDYERFIQVAQDQLGNEFYLQTRAVDPDTPYLYTKIRLKGTEYVTPFTEIRDMHKGISIDLFPFDWAPPLDTPEFINHLTQANALIKKHDSLVARQVPAGLPHRPARNAEEVLGHAIMKARHAKYAGKSKLETQRAFEEHVGKYNGDPNADWAVSYLVKLGFIHKDDLLPYQELQFEDLTLLAPNKPAPLLACLFGDFKKLPPKHLQHGHRITRWKVSSGESSYARASEHQL